MFFLIPFFLFSLASAHAEAPPAPLVIDRLEAAVNSSLILLSDVEHFRKLLKLRSQLDPIFAGTAVALRGAGADTGLIVDFLIDEHVIAQAFPVTDSEVEQEINSIQSNNHIDRQQLKSALSEQGFSFDDYFELIRASASKRNLIDRDIRSKASISEDDIKDYFYNHYSRSSAASRIYQIKIIYISPQSFKAGSAAHDAAANARKQIETGEPFEDVARRVSDDSSASSGGDLGEMTEDQMSPTIRDSLKGLKIGQVSPVLGNAKSGYSILKLADVKSDDSAEMKRVHDEIRGQLLSAEYQHQIQLWLERQKQAAFIRKSK